MNIATLLRGLALSFTALVLVACTSQNQPPAETPEPPAATLSGPPVSINAQMVSLVDHAGHALWDAEQEGKAPKTDQDWENIAEHATQLAAAATLITLPGTGPNDREWTQQPNWLKWSRAMGDAGLAALKASDAKSQEALVTANGRLVESCEGCHKEFKPDLPSEGISHKHMHVAP